MYLSRFVYLCRFTVFYFADLVRANVMVLLDIFGKNQSGVSTTFTFKTRCETELEYFLLSNLITFTPGTICVEADPDKKEIEIHDMFLEDGEEACRVLRDMYERPLLFILRGELP